MHKNNTKAHESADRQIRELYEGRRAWSAREGVYHNKLRAALGSLSQENEIAALYRLLGCLGGRSRLPAIEPVLPRLGVSPGNTGLDALLHFARFSLHWLREPETWNPEGENAREQAGALARHLFAAYPLPAFLDAAWLGGFAPAAEGFRRWFVHLGAGEKQEALRFPLPMTHRATHFFLHAPADYSVAAALHHGQIKALGGSDSLSRAVAESFLSELQDNEAFWFSALMFFVNHPEIPPWQVGPVLDYLRFRKFGTGANDAPEPCFSLKGRTPDALLKRMHDWHETLSRLSPKTRASWPPSGFAPLDKEEPDTLSPASCRWRITELTNTLTLLEEGREMRHCVRSYADACAKGKSAIFSLRLALSDNPAPRRLLTLEINLPRRAIVQVRAKCNQTLASLRQNRRITQARQILKDWAHREHLVVGCAL